MDLWVWSVLLLALALVLLLVDVFVPSGGVLATLCVAAVIGAIVVGFMSGPLVGLTVLVASAVIFPVTIYAAIQFWPHTPIGRLILIQRPESPDDVLPDVEEHRNLKTLIGKHGVTKSKMLPSGIISLEGRSYDAVSEGIAIEVGQPVRVVAIRMQRIVVRPVEASDLAPPPPSPSADDLLSRPLESLGLESIDDPLA